MNLKIKALHFFNWNVSYVIVSNAKPVESPLNSNSPTGPATDVITFGLIFNYIGIPVFTCNWYEFRRQGNTSVSLDIVEE